MSRPKGKYLCFEGGDGCGKSTLTEALYQRLGPERASLKSFPSKGPIGKLIRHGLQGKEQIENPPFLYLFAADGLQEEPWIEDQLNHWGKHVICDRHPTISGRVFQLEHHPTEHIESVYNSAAADGVSMPDVLFVLDIPAPLAIDRMERRKKYKDVVFEKHDIAHVDMIRQRYLEIAERFGAVVLNGAAPIDNLIRMILATAEIT